MIEINSKTCGSVVYRTLDSGDIEFLLVKGLNHEWGFSKGNQEGSESDHETAKREVKEETGLDVDFIDGFEERYFYDLNLGRFIFKRKIKKEVIIFLSKVNKDVRVKTQNSEILDFDWFSYDEGLDVINYKERKRILKEAHGFIASN